MLNFQSDNAFEGDHNILPRNLIFQKSSSPRFPRETLLPGNRIAQVHPIGFDCVRESYPRQIPWSEFPVVMEPAVAVSSKQGQIGDFLTQEELAGHWDRQEYFLVDDGDETTPPRDRYLINAVGYALRNKYAPGSDFAVRSGPNAAFRLVEDGYMRLGWTDWKFNYCYKLNFRTIGFEIMRGFADVTAEIAPHVAGSTRRYIEALRERWTKRSASALDEPLALQVLFALGTASAEDAREAYGIAANFQDSSNGYSLSEKLRDGQWVGTGKYQPMPTSSTAISNYILTFVALGFAELKEGSVSLTNAGHRFLTAFHKTSCDPDATLRFASPETGMMDSSAEEGIEEWLLRFFRKMKQKAT